MINLRDDRGSMGDSVTTIIAIFIAAILMFLFPLLAISERHEDIAQLATQEAVIEFVNKISTSGLIKSSEYDMFMQRLASTGNKYEIEIEIQHLDENQGKKVGITSNDLIGENVRYSTFTTAIFENEIFLENGAYPLKKGDIVYVTVKNTNQTIAQQLRGFFYSVTGQGTYQIGASYSSMVVNNGVID